MCFFRLDKDGTVLDCKGGSSTDLHLPLMSMIARKIHEIPLADAGTKLQETFQEAQRTKQMVSTEYSATVEKKEYYYEARFVPVSNDNVIVIIRNITERVEAEQEREKSLSLYLATIESTADGILVVNNKGHIVSFNSKFVEMWNIPNDVISPYRDADVFNFMLDQLNAPESFFAIANTLSDMSEAENYNVLELRDGRILRQLFDPAAHRRCSRWPRLELPRYDGTEARGEGAQRGPRARTTAGRPILPFHQLGGPNRSTTA